MRVNCKKYRINNITIVSTDQYGVIDLHNPLDVISYDTYSCIVQTSYIQHRGAMYQCVLGPACRPFFYPQFVSPILATQK